ncbi:NAD(P)-dependent alcohol dehydrogenase, partial [Deinococcus sp. 6YEL10]|nr:NAD(P)-dependent alcohol dehydrogenase [Deinococcus sp. 6YEL10]
MILNSRTSLLTGPRTLGWEQRPVSPPGAREVRVRVTRVGVCGSDVHY